MLGALVIGAVSLSVSALAETFEDRLVRGEEAAPVSVSVNDAGNTVVDFGKHGCGWIEVDVERAGAYLFIWGELLNEKGSVETNELFTVREGMIRCADLPDAVSRVRRGDVVIYTSSSEKEETFGTSDAGQALLGSAPVGGKLTLPAYGVAVIKVR